MAISDFEYTLVPNDYGIFEEQHCVVNSCNFYFLSNDSYQIYKMQTISTHP